MLPFSVGVKLKGKQFFNGGKEQNKLIKIRQSILEGKIEKAVSMDELDTIFNKVSDKLEFWNTNCPDNVGYRQEYINELKSEGK